MNDASCVGLPPELWFGGGFPQNVVKRVCARCPVLLECREYALGDPSITSGYWGGMTQLEREKARGAA